MKGDFSRIQFDPAKHYAGVLHQQGRVWLDSDWNEDVAQRLDLLRQELRDLVGPCGVPSPGSFQISSSTDPAHPDNFQISGGHGYVDGLLCLIEGNISYFNQPDLPVAPPINVPTDGSTLTALIYLEVWHRLITYLEDDSIREVALGGPDTSVRLKTVTQVKVVPIPAGTVKCSDASQFLPQAGSGQLTTLQPVAGAAPTACQLPDPANFTGAENHLYRVEIYDGGDIAGAPGGFVFTDSLAADAAAGATTITLSKALTADQVNAANRCGFITVSDATGASERLPLTSIDATGTVLTLGQPLAQAHTAANQAKVTGGVARFKWSRDNASFAVAVTDVKADRVSITLASLGHDLATSLRQGDLVELTDDASDLGPARGHLTHLANDPDPDQFTVQLADALPAAFQLNGEVSTRHLILRRWDGIGDVAAAFDPAATPGMNLGDGVHVQFSGLDLRAGDYWQIAVRTADGSVQALTNAPPRGIERHRSPLAIVTWGPPPATTPPAPPATGVVLTTIQDCRRIFPALVDFPQADKGFHIDSVFAVNAANTQTLLPNDTDVHVDAFNGIDILCDNAPDPNSVSRPTCFLSVDYPVVDGGAASAWYFPVNLAGTLSVDTTKMLISWRVLPETQNVLIEMLNASPNERGVLARITLKGQFIWALNNPNLYLDGEAFGQRLTSAMNTALQLPSGDGRRGGDFHMWFWIVAAISFAKQILVSPAQVYIGDTATFTVTLSSSAPAGAAPATLTSTVPAVAAVPGSIAVPVGSTSFSFKATGATAGVTTVSASFGTTPVPPTTTLTVMALPLLNGQIAISPPSILVGVSAVAIVTINGAAPSTGAVVTLTSSNPPIAAVSAASVTIPAGSNNISFTIHGGAAGSATISASLKWPNGSTSNASGVITVRVKGKENVKDTTKETIRDKVVFREQVVNPKFLPRQTVMDVSQIGFGGRARSFIRPEERPPVEHAILEASRPEPSSDPDSGE
jgi:hypothetical protein